MGNVFQFICFSCGIILLCLHPVAAFISSPMIRSIPKVFIRNMSSVKQFDYLVIGGGSGGIASARRAAEFNKTIGLIEEGRLGGTCVNVGCVPKKVMFYTSSIAEMLHDCAGYGFELSGATKFTWKTIKEKRDDYIKR